MRCRRESSLGSKADLSAFARQLNSIALNQRQVLCQYHLHQTPFITSSSWVTSMAWKGHSVDSHAFDIPAAAIALCEHDIAVINSSSLYAGVQKRRTLRGRACGATVAAAAALLADLSSERDGELKLRIGQGVDMGRPSMLLTRVRKENGAVISAHVGGRCVQMMEGIFHLAGD
jgi:hypothetical protein